MQSFQMTLLWKKETIHAYQPYFCYLKTTTNCTISHVSAILYITEYEQLAILISVLLNMCKDVCFLSVQRSMLSKFVLRINLRLIVEFKLYHPYLFFFFILSSLSFSALFPALLHHPSSGSKQRNFDFVPSCCLWRTNKQDGKL